jgi:quinol monooxygenase YgiN
VPVEHMLGVPQLLAKAPGCKLYVINTSAADTNTVWITEVWSTQAELDASLSVDNFKASIQRVAFLLANPPSETRMTIACIRRAHTSRVNQQDLATWTCALAQGTRRAKSCVYLNLVRNSRRADSTTDRYSYRRNKLEPRL